MSPPRKITVINMNEPRLKGKRGGVAVIYNNILKTKKSSFKYTSFEVLVLSVKIYTVV